MLFSPPDKSCVTRKRRILPEALQHKDWGRFIDGFVDIFDDCGVIVRPIAFMERLGAIDPGEPFLLVRYAIHLLDLSAARTCISLK
jgi:hypothetical protein